MIGAAVVVGGGRGGSAGPVGVGVFGVEGGELGRGVLGGPFISQSQVGLDAARLGLRQLSPEGRNEIQTVHIGMDTVAYDVRELAR